MANLATNSRFSLLKIDDDDDDDATDVQKKDSKSKSKSASSGAKKKSKKKKKVEADKAETEQLRNLAFAGSVAAKPGKGGSNGAPHTNGMGSGDTVPKEQWEQWKKTDKEFTADTYENDLQQAILLSKLQQQEEKEVRSAVAAVEDVTGKGRDKKKKKKDKPNTMSLDTFNQLGENSAMDSLDYGLSESPNFTQHNKTPTLPNEDPDPKFFDRVSEDASKIIRKEQIQEEYRKQYVVESARIQKYQEEVETKDKEINTLRATVQNLEDELKQVKKRNKQLCHILGHGEMKEKSEILVQVDQLAQVKDELTEQLSLLMVELEKERSKVHMLQGELSKHKLGHHAGK